MKKNRVIEKLLRRGSPLPLAEMIPLLESWFATPAGKEILRQEQELVDEALSTLFGFYLLQISACRNLLSCEKSKVRHIFPLGPLQGSGIIGITSEDELPVETESVDVVLLHHTMEYSPCPHQLLREVSRVVVGSGHLVIVSFNPFSCIGLWSLAGRVRTRSIWNNRLLSLSRLADWLELVDFRIQSVQHGFYRPPIGRPFMDRLSPMERFFSRQQLPLGGFYVVVARKQVSRLTPVRQRWRKGGISFIPVMEPSLYTPPGKQQADRSEQTSDEPKPDR